MISKKKVNQLINNRPRKVTIHHEWGKTVDIIAVLMRVANKDYLKAQVAEFAQNFKGNTFDEQYYKLGELWSFARNRIQYREDSDGKQKIKHPARTWYDGYADCKSLTIFIYFVCRAINIPCFIRFASYSESGEIGHVYPVAVINNREVIMDAVFTAFDAEEIATKIKDKYTKVYSKNKMTQISEIAGTTAKQRRKKLVLPKMGRVDVSKVTDGELWGLYKAHEIDLLAHIYEANGDTENADIHKRVHEVLQDVLKGKQSRTVLSGQETYFVNQIISVVQTRNVAATEGRNFEVSKMGNSYRILGPNDPTAAQIAECEEAATLAAGPMPVLSNYNSHSAWMNARTLWQTQISISRENCLDDAVISNMLESTLKPAGSSFMYALMPFDNSHNQSINIKRLFQLDWLFRVGNVTGLSDATIKQICRTGVIAAAENTPEGIRANILPSMYPAGTITNHSLSNNPFNPQILSQVNSASVGVIDPLTISIVVAIVKGVISIAATAAIEGMKVKAQLESNQANAFSDLDANLLSPSNIIDEYDFTPLVPVNSGAGGAGNSYGGTGNGSGNNSMLPLIFGAGFLFYTLNK